MKVILDLPEANVFDAASFGLWLDGVIRAAQQEGELTTIVSTISVDAS